MEAVMQREKLDLAWTVENKIGTLCKQILRRHKMCSLKVAWQLKFSIEQDPAIERGCGNLTCKTNGPTSLKVVQRYCCSASPFASGSSFSLSQSRFCSR